MYPPLIGYEAGRSAGSFTSTMTWMTLQGESILPGGVQTISEESIICVRRGLGTPNVYLLCNGSTTGLAGSLSFAGSLITISLGTGSKIAFFGTYAGPAPNMYTKSPLVYDYELIAGADNTYSNNSTVVNGYIKIGTPYVIDHEMINRVVDSTPLKKNVGGYSAIAQVKTGITPDQGVIVKRRQLHLGECSANVVIICNEEYGNLLFSATNQYNVQSQRIVLSGSRKINLTEVPSVSDVVGYVSVCVCVTYGNSGLTISFMNNPPAALQGLRLPSEYENATWLCTLLLKVDDTITYPSNVSLLYGETVGCRAAVFVGLKGNKIFCTGSGHAVVPDGEDPIAYSLSVPKCFAQDAWADIVSSYNDEFDGKKRIEFSQTGQMLMKRPREE